MPLVVYKHSEVELLLALVDGGISWIYFLLSSIEQGNGVTLMHSRSVLERNELSLKYSPQLSYGEILFGSQAHLWSYLGYNELMHPTHTLYLGSQLAS